MSEAKIDLKVGETSFTAEGTETWLGEQLDKLLSKFPEVRTGGIAGTTGSGAKTPHSTHGTDSAGQPKGGSGKTLAAFIKDTKATTKQARKFLAVAMWLHDEKGMKRIATGDVSKALSEHNQGRLSNAAQCLINNAKTGGVVREGKEFYVTDEGRAELVK